MKLGAPSPASSDFGRYAAAAAATLGLASTAGAQFVGDYSYGAEGTFTGNNVSGSFGNWTSATTFNNSFGQLELDGSGTLLEFQPPTQDGMWDFTAVAAASGQVSFDFQGAGFSYNQNGSFVPVADSPSAASAVSFSVITGETFGFRVSTSGFGIGDETGTAAQPTAPLLFQISNFSAPASAVPEPGTNALLAGIATLGFAALRARRKQRAQNAD